MQTTETFISRKRRQARPLSRGWQLDDGGTQTFPGPPLRAACFSNSQIVLCVLLVFTFKEK